MLSTVVSQEGVLISMLSLFTLVKKFKNTELVVDLKRKSRSSLLGEDHYRFVVEAMAVDNELTSRQLFYLFTAKYPKIQISISTVKQACRYLGWISKKTTKVLCSYSGS